MEATVMSSPLTLCLFLLSETLEESRNTPLEKEGTKSNMELLIGQLVLLEAEYWKARPYVTPQRS